MYIQVIVMHLFSTGKCIVKGKMLQKSHLYKTTTLSSLCFLTYPKRIMLQTLGRQTKAKYLRNA